MKLKEIKDQSKFCTELMKRVNDDVQKSHVSYGTIDKHTQMIADIVRLRRELNDLRAMLNPWEVEE